MIDITVRPTPALDIAAGLPGPPGPPGPLGLANANAVTRAGGSTPVAVPLPFLNVKDFGAAGDGTTDDTGAIQAAIGAADAWQSTAYTGGINVVFPPGVYITSAPLTVASSFAVTLAGAGKRATIIRPTTALAGLPVIDFVDCRDHGLTGMYVQGVPSGTPALCGVRNWRALNTTGPLLGQRLTMSDVIVGSDTNASSMVDAVVVDAASPQMATNGDGHLFLNVDIQNVVNAGYRIGYGNALANRIVAGNITRANKVVECRGGNFYMLGAFIAGIRTGGVFFDFYPDTLGGMGTLTHASYINYSSESQGDLLHSAPSCERLKISLHGCSHYGGSATATNVDFQASNYSVLYVSNCNLNYGAAGATLNAPDATSHVVLRDSVLQLTQINYNGSIVHGGNRWVTTVNFANLGSGRRANTGGENGGGQSFSPEVV